MNELRKTEPLETPRVFLCSPPHSNFKFVEDFFGPLPSLSRILSQCRKLGFKSIIFEKIPSVGFSKEDDDVLYSQKNGMTSVELVRLSFFTQELKTLENLETVDDSSFLGYAIVKSNTFEKDSVGHRILRKEKRWHVFESVIQSARHDNNYVHVRKKYEVSINKREFSIAGNLYCQQNALTYVCAHVALRTALSAILSDGDISYSEMNSILEKNAIPHGIGDELGEAQIIKIIEAKELTVFKAAYSDDPKYENPKVPYHKYIYAGIESGLPVLLGAQFPVGGHIIPILGHTFNEDTWVPYADASYFRIGADTGFISSETWVSTYIGHDDNFGSNFCIPRNYLSGKQILVLIIAPKECQYDAIEAEAIAIDYLYSIFPHLTNLDSSFWVQKLLLACREFKVVLRASLITREDYLKHLLGMEDWQGNRITEKLVEGINNLLVPNGELFWMVEVSHPELFPANNRKLGEILLKATIKPEPQRDYKNFVLARLPENFYILMSVEKSIDPVYYNLNSPLKDHVAVYSKT
jgi:hypothetical protein